MTVEVQHFDVIVIGGGPAGMSAALWCADLGLGVVLIEQEAEPGGQLLSTFGPIENYLGVRTSNGRELRDLFAQQLEGRDVTRTFGISIGSVDLSAKTVDLTDGHRIAGRSIVLATGVRRRSLRVPGEAEFVGKGILDSGQKARQEVAGKRVIIVGGGDAALENALILSDTAEYVSVVHRRDKFTARSEFVTAASRRANVEFLFGTRITGIVGKDSVHAVEVISGDGPAQLDCEYVLIRIGVEPNVDLFKDAIDLDERGYIRVNADCSTSVEGVYAAGDVASSVSPTIATAVGMGATAAKAITALLSKGRA